MANLPGMKYEKKWNKCGTRINLYLGKGAWAAITFCKYGFVMNIKYSLPQFKPKLRWGVDSTIEAICAFVLCIQTLGYYPKSIRIIIFF